MKQLARAGRKILFVATKKQAKEIVAAQAQAVNMPYVTERWAGGMLTNFPTIRKAVKKMNTIDKMISDGTFETLAKRERLQITRQRAKLETTLGSIADLNRLPSALFVVDVQKEINAVKEANRLNIPVIAMVDTCCDPTNIDYVIPANDDAAKSIALVTETLCKAVAEGLGIALMDAARDEQVHHFRQNVGGGDDFDPAADDQISEKAQGGDGDRQEQQGQGGFGDLFLRADRIDNGPDAQKDIDDHHGIEQGVHRAVGADQAGGAAG